MGSRGLASPSPIGRPPSKSTQSSRSPRRCDRRGGACHLIVDVLPESVRLPATGACSRTRRGRIRAPHCLADDAGAARRLRRPRVTRPHLIAQCLDVSVDSIRTRIARGGWLSTRSSSTCSESMQRRWLIGGPTAVFGERRFGWPTAAMAIRRSTSCAPSLITAAEVDGGITTAGAERIGHRQCSMPSPDRRCRTTQARLDDRWPPPGAPTTAATTHRRPASHRSQPDLDSYCVRSLSAVSSRLTNIGWSWATSAYAINKDELMPPAEFPDRRSTARP